MSNDKRPVYKTMQGKIIELDKLIMKNETTLAVGNVKVNARGDELGPGGKIIKKTDTDQQVVRSDSVMHQKTIKENSTVQPIVEKTKPTPKPVKSKVEE